MSHPTHETTKVRKETLKAIRTIAQRFGTSNSNVIEIGIDHVARLSDSGMLKRIRKLNRNRGQAAA